MSDLTDQAGRLIAARRRIWQRIEKAHGAGASNEELADMRGEAGAIDDQQKAVGTRIYNNTLLRDGRMPYAREHDRDR